MHIYCNSRFTRNILAHESLHAICTLKNLINIRETLLNDLDQGVYKSADGAQLCGELKYVFSLVGSTRVTVICAISVN